MATWRDVRRLALELPGTCETSRGAFAWSVQKKSIAWQRPLRQSDIAALGKDAPTGSILCVRTPDLELKELLLATDPAVFFTTQHFHGYPAILLRLEAISSKKLREVLTEAWLARAPRRAVAAFLQERAGTSKKK
jgi:hypothetical protein